MDEMEFITVDLVDKGYAEFYNIQIGAFNFLNQNLEICFLNNQTKNKTVILKLANAVSYDLKEPKILMNSHLLLRVDSESSSYGLDISIQLKNPDLKLYKVLYIFERKHQPFVFRALAQNILVLENISFPSMNDGN